MSQSDLNSTISQKTQASGFSDVAQAIEFTPAHSAAAQHINDFGSKNAGMRVTLYSLAAITLVIVLLDIDLAYLYFSLTAFVVAGNFPIFLFLFKPQLGQPSPPDAQTLDAIDAHELPFYSVMVPVLNEPNMIPQIEASLSRLNYPHHRMEILILLEARDQATIARAKTIDWAPHIHLVAVPPGEPSTKARACNYGLSIARGEYIVIFDAEDKPDSEQLLTAAAVFASRDDSVVCLQAPLQIHLPDNKWLQNQFALEYKILFSLSLQVLSNLNMVMPLGGSSNHFHANSLRNVGGWDAFNLTEDAELSMRLAKKGFSTQMIAPPTIENAPHSTLIWFNQRTRWLTGHIQTWCIHMRHPRHTLRLIGWPNFLAFNAIVLGRLFSGLLHASYLTYLLVSLPHLTSAEVSFMIYLAAPVPITLLTIGVMYSPATSWPQKLWLSITQPFYWALTSLALLYSFWRILSGRLDWLKTPHQPY